MLKIKYLPVDGELKLGDLTLWDQDEGFYAHQFVTVNKSCIMHAQISGWKKYKRFLTSTDIQMGDKEIYIHKPDGTEITKVELVEIVTGEVDGKVHSALRVQHPTLGTFGTLIQNGFRVIGEISPDANWINDGDHIKDDQWKLRWWSIRRERFLHDVTPGDELTTAGDMEKEGLLIKYISILGPCGHFH